MERRTFLKNAALGAATSAVAAPAIAESLPSLQWRFAASWPKSLDVGYGATELIAKRVGELLGFSCAARGVDLHLGMRRDADVCAVRRLVA